MLGGAPGGVGLWGYLLHLRASDRLLLIVDCPSRGALEAASRHAALAYLERRPSRHAHCCRPRCCAWCLFPSGASLCQRMAPQQQRAGRFGVPCCQWPHVDVANRDGLGSAAPVPHVAWHEVPCGVLCLCRSRCGVLQGGRCPARDRTPARALARLLRLGDLPPWPAGVLAC